MNRLSEVPSELIRQAMSDYEQAMAHSHYEVDMTRWHAGTQGKMEACKVCLAGAVIAFSLDVLVEAKSNPHQFEFDTCQKLHALDDFRCGRIYSGLNLMNKQIPENMPHFTAISQFNGKNPEMWTQDMYHLIELFEANDL